jgi:hypothetical protein
MALIMIDSASLQGHHLASLFRPSFLRSVRAGRHRGVLRRLGVSDYASRFGSLCAFLTAAYGLLEREYRCEYVFKNELLDAGLAGEYLSPHYAVYTELPIAFWAGRVDLLVCNDTTLSFEVKSEVDRLDRLRAQLSLNSKLFDLNYVVCSPDVAGPVKRELSGTRAGIVVADRDGYTLARKAKSNAKSVEPDAIFGTLRDGEVRSILSVNSVALPECEPANRFGHYRAAFSRLKPLNAHSGLLKALLSRSNGLQAAKQFEELPRSLKHLFFQTKEAERRQLLGRSMLARSVG